MAKSRIHRGASPYAGGCRFAVRARHAEEVFVVGTFNDWHETANAMAGNPVGRGLPMPRLPGPETNSDIGSLRRARNTCDSTPTPAG